MNIALYQQFTHQLLFYSGIGLDAEWNFNAWGLILFLLLFMLICFHFSKDIITFVRLFPYWMVFVLFNMQFDQRKLIAGFFKLHRLLYFIRAVSVCPLRK